LDGGGRRGGHILGVQEERRDQALTQERGRAAVQAAGLGGQPAQQMHDHGEPDGEFNGGAGVTQEARQVDVTFEPAEELLEPPAILPLKH
jgi:hypothetical protein